MTLAPAIRASLGLHAAAAASTAVLPQSWPWALGAVGLNHAALGLAGMLPCSAVLGPNLRRLPGTGRAEVALTFDDGPDPEVTPRVLDLLDRAGMRASFFCIGTQARAHPGLVAEIVRRGHAVENHSWSHLRRFAALPPWGLRAEVVRAQAVLTALAGRPPRFFRSPMGLRSPLLQPVLEARGLRLASWTRRALDGVWGDPAAAAMRLRRGLSAGDVLLLHDGRAARGPDGRAVALTVLPELLALLAARGLAGVTLGEGVAREEGPGSCGLR